MTKTKQNDRKKLEMSETLANGYSSESTQCELSSEYQHDRVWIFFKDIWLIWPIQNDTKKLTKMTETLANEFG